MSETNRDLHHRSFWLWEVWLDNREIFKTLVGDLFLFLFLMALVSIGHYIIDLLPLTAPRRELFDRWHFLVVFTVWIFLSLTLLAEIVVAIARKFQDTEGKTRASSKMAVKQKVR